MGLAGCSSCLVDRIRRFIAFHAAVWTIVCSFPPFCFGETSLPPASAETSLRKNPRVLSPSAVKPLSSRDFRGVPLTRATFSPNHSTASLSWRRKARTNSPLRLSTSITGQNLIRRLSKRAEELHGISTLHFDVWEGNPPDLNLRHLIKEAHCSAPPCPQHAACQNKYHTNFSLCSALDVDGPWKLNTVIVLRNVYINSNGVVFNQSAVFDFDDCTLQKSPKRYRASHKHLSGLPVVHLQQAFSLIHHWGSNFYHNLLEVFPQFFGLSSFLRRNPTLPILMKEVQYREYARFGRPLVGIDEEQLNVIYPATHHMLFFVEELLQPHMPRCLKPDINMISHLRTNFFLRKDGLPFFDSSLMPRFTKPPSRQEVITLPGDWTVVLFLRTPGRKRSLINDSAVFHAAVDVFGKDRVVVTRKHDLNILEAREFYQKARVFLAVHGSALANAVFMPNGSFMFEIRLTGYNIPVYEMMCPGIGLNYHYIVAQGHKGSLVSPNMTKLHEVLHAIKFKMQQQDSGEGHTTP